MHRTVPVAALALSILLTGCAALFTQAPPPARTVHVKVVADPSFAGHSRWRANAQNLVAAASDVYRSWFGLGFVVDTMVVWDMASSPCYQTMFDWDCLCSRVGRDSADIVVHFVKAANPEEHRLAGISLYEQGYVRVTQADWPQAVGGYQHAFITLVHELGHAFGAFHVYHDQKHPAHYIMNPVLSPKTVFRRGVELETNVPEWHPANQVIIRAMRDRPFAGAGWDSANWNRIHAAYRTVRQQYVGFRIDSRGRMVDFADNELVQPDYFSYLSSWAMLCGEDSLALQYLDSVRVTLDGVRNTCLDCGANCQAHVCWYAGTQSREVERWYRTHIALYSLEKAHLLLRAGEFAQAEDAFRTFESLRSAMSLADKRRHRAAFEYYRDHYADHEPGEENR